MEERKGMKENLMEKLHASHEKHGRESERRWNLLTKVPSPARESKEKEDQVVLKKGKVDPFWTIEGENEKRQIPDSQIHRWDPYTG